jgi:hypothetical protein
LVNELVALARAGGKFGKAVLAENSLADEEVAA